MSSSRPSRRSIGAAAEAFVAAYLEAQGYRIQARNWRSPFGEIDLIVEGEGWLRFVEVRAKRSDRFGSPEESLTPRKRRRLLQTALAYLGQQGEREPCWRVDLASVTLDSQGRPVSVTFVENVLGE
ncbi:MAG TPA: YraN family protein [Thermoflexus sp.]|uniref:YraN family protein n=1 Tax=Thermoflexus sp. TaxID=1969742 RepID=UPI002C138817|nr:YraN family protein [Thermoflexus sp.]